MSTFVMLIGGLWAAYGVYMIFEYSTEENKEKMDVKKIGICIAGGLCVLGVGYVVKLLGA